MSITMVGINRRGLMVDAGVAAVAASGLARPAIGQGNSGHTLRFKPVNDLANMDQVAGPAHSTANAAFMVYDALYGLDISLAPRPQMVEGHERSDDGLTWRFALRDGLLFHDGEKVRAQDAIASIARWSQCDPFGQVLRARTEEMRAVSDKQFEIRLRKPFPHMLFGPSHAVRAARAGGSGSHDGRRHTGQGLHKQPPTPELAVFHVVLSRG